MNLLCFKTDSQHASSSLLHRIDFGEVDRAAFLKLVQSDLAIHEALWLRQGQEIICLLLVHDKKKGMDCFFDRLSEIPEVDRHELEKAFRVTFDESAIRQLFMLAAGIEFSPGDDALNIPASMREGRELSVKAGTCGGFLGTLIDQGLQVMRRVQEETLYRAEFFSLSTIALEIITKIFDTLHRKNVLLIGSDVSARNVLHSLCEKGPKTVSVSGVAGAEAGHLDFALKTRTLEYEDLPAAVPEMDVILLAEHQDDVIESLSRSLKSAYSRTRVLFDLRKEGPALSAGNDAFLFTTEDMERLLRDKRKKWKEELERVEALVDREVEAFVAWMNAQRVGHFLSVIRTRTEAIRQRHLDKYGKKLNAQEKEELVSLVDDLLDTVLDEITGNIRSLKSGSQVNLREYELLCRLFDVLPEELRTEDHSD